MALAYRIHFDSAEARRIVDAWRAANSWAPEFWGRHHEGESFGLWGAALSAWESPGLITTAGRVAFVYRDDYLGGALFMALPSGRLLTYPRPRWRDVEVVGKDGKATGEKRTELSFRRARGRTKLWHGTLAENCCGAATQVLTFDGWKQIIDIRHEDLIWDGADWVIHGGVVAQGVQRTIDLDGVRLTPEHKILMRGGEWVEAQHLQEARQPGILEPVYDILNCGPQHRFAVRGNTKLYTVHNCTQAVAADILRATVARIETNPALTWLQIRMTTHDEIVAECDEDRAEEAKAILRREMLILPEWAEGLPLAAETSSCSWYTKSKAALQAFSNRNTTNNVEARL
jgi:hypothetical protein